MIDPVNRPVYRPSSVQLRLVHVGTGRDRLRRGAALAFLDQPGQLTRQFLSPELARNERGCQNTCKKNTEYETLHTSSTNLNDIRVEFVVVPPQAFGCGIEKLIRIF